MARSAVSGSERMEPAAGPGKGRRRVLPGPWTAGLMVLHVAGLLVVRRLAGPGHDSYVWLFHLQGSTSHPAAVVLHLCGDGSVATLAGVLAALWAFARPIESRGGGLRLVALYAAGTVIGGGVYFALGQAASELAEVPLSVPAGGLAACATAAWRAARLHDDRLSLPQWLGRLSRDDADRRDMAVAKLVAVASWLVAGLVFFFGGAGATGWLLAAGAGAAAGWGMEAARPASCPR